MRTALCFFTLGVVGIVACATQSSKEVSEELAILNGGSSDRSEVVLLSSGGLGCSGTLIARDVVMTAAHCGDYRSVYVGYSKRTTDANVQIGEPGPNDTWKRYEVAERADMPGFANAGCPMQGAADVALLRLTEPVVNAPIAKLADRAPAIGEECLVVGYGRHNGDDNLETVEGTNTNWTYGERRQARVTIFEKGGRDGGSGVDWFSAKGIDGAHSRGDSGGAIFCGGKLAGVVSCSVDRNQAVLDLVKVYGNIETARAFVDETMQRWRDQ